MRHFISEPRSPKLYFVGNVASNVSSARPCPIDFVITGARQQPCCGRLRVLGKDGKRAEIIFMNCFKSPAKIHRVINKLVILTLNSILTLTYILKTMNSENIGNKNMLKFI